MPRLTRLTRLTLLPLALGAGLLLAGCESREERAERHFQSALAYMAEGKVELAMTDLRRVFDYDGFHKEARQLYADTLLAQGDVRGAAGQYLRLIEQYPDTLGARVTLAELAFRGGEWEEVERHANAAIAIAPAEPQVEALAAALAYRTAALAEDAAGREAAAARARAVLDALPDNLVARRIVVSHLLSGPAPAEALPEIDRALALQPDAFDLHEAKLQLLARAEDLEGTRAQLRTMFDRFPDNDEVRSNLLLFLVRTGDIDGAEAVLREIAARTPDDPAGQVGVVQFLLARRGAEAARAELDRLIAAGTPGTATFRAMRATIDFGAGAQEAAIAEMRAILDGATPSDETARVRMGLVQMLTAAGDEAGARAEVEAVLAADATNVEALKMRAGWAIREDRPGDAITDLRAALNQAPRDAQVLTLMAEAHQREGATELVGERLSLAVEVSGAAPEESLRYARFLLGENRIAPARAVLGDALRAAALARRERPGDPAPVAGTLALIRLSSEIAVREEDWAALDEMLATLDGIATPEAAEVAAALRATRMLGQEDAAGTDAAIAFLEGEIARGGAGAASAEAMLALTRMRAGDAAGARAALESALERRPGDPQLLMLGVGLRLATGDLAGAEADLRAILAGEPAAEAAAQQLYRLLAAQGRAAEATGVLETAIAAAPRSAMLRMLRGAELEQAGDIEGAIAIFEAVYADDTDNLLAANNLASLLGAHRTDPASLERAAVVAARLRGRDNPAFQDTYGWIEFRRGNLDEALTHLEPAAAGLPQDPLVQYHLAMTYLALDRDAEAAAQFRKALDLAGDNPLPQFAEARAKLAEIDAAAPAPSPGTPPAAGAPATP